MKIPVACLMLMLFAACSLSEDMDINRYEQFKKQHIKEDMEIEQCDAVIKNRDISQKKGKAKVCKPINTFILSEESTVRSVCESGEKFGKGGTLIKSKTRFDIVECRLKKKCAYPRCLYTGKKLKKKIIIKCINGNPVHYNGSVYNYDN